MSKKSTTKKAAKKKVAKKKTAANRAKRYAEEFKREVVEFVESVGRGGVAKAVKKFGVSALSVSNWKKKLGDGGEPAAKPSAKSKPGSRDQILAKMTKLSAKLAANEKEHAAIKKQFDQLKAML